MLWLQTAEASTGISDPPNIQGVRDSYWEQCELYKWVHAQMRIRKLDTAFLPAQRSCLEAWDRQKGKRVDRLGRDCQKARRAQEVKQGLQPTKLGPAGCLAEAWGFPGIRGCQAGYTLQTLSNNIIACNQAVNKQQKKPCSEQDLNGVIIFTRQQAIDWNNQRENLRAVLRHAVGSSGPGILRVAEQTGLLLASVQDGNIRINWFQPGHGSQPEQLKKHLTTLTTAHGLPSGVIPAVADLKRLAASDLFSAIVSRSAVHERSRLRGRELLAQEIGWSLAPAAQFPSGHWQVMQMYSSGSLA